MFGKKKPSQYTACLVYENGLTGMQLVDNLTFIMEINEIVTELPKTAIVWKPNMIYNRSQGRIINLDFEEEKLFSANALTKQLVNNVLSDKATRALRTTTEEDLAEMEHDKEVNNWWKKNKK